MSEGLRWKIARLLDRSRRYCWADLVSWALDRGGTLRDCKVDWACRDDIAAHGVCYCGKIKAPQSTEGDQQ